MTGWERLGIGGVSRGYLSGRLSPRQCGLDEIARVRLGHHDRAPKRGGDPQPVAPGLHQWRIERRVRRCRGDRPHPGRAGQR
jgi:hypothetical protein